MSRVSAWRCPPESRPTLVVIRFSRPRPNSFSRSHDPRFITLVRGVLVNLDYVVSFQDGQCRLSDHSTLPVSVRSQNLLVKLWETYKFNRVRSGR